MNTAIRFGALYHLQVEPREKALADPKMVTHSGKVNQAIIEAERQQTGRAENPLTTFLDGDFYSVTGDTAREIAAVEDDYFKSLPKVERFVLDHADSEEEAAEVLGRDRLGEIKSGIEQHMKQWIQRKTREGQCIPLRINLDA